MTHPDRFLLVLQATVLSVTALYFGQPVLMPLVTAALLTFLLRPAVVWLERRRVPRAAAVSLIVLGIILTMSGVAWVVTQQFHDLALHLDDYKGHIRSKIDLLKNSQGVVVKNIREILSEFSDAAIPTVSPGGATVPVAPGTSVVVSPNTQTPQLVQVVPESMSPAQALRMVGESLATPLTTAAVIVVLVIFMLMGFEDLRNRVLRLAGQTKLTVTTKTLDDVGKRISSYLLMNALVNGGFGLAVFLGLALIGVNYAALWGFLAATLRFVPYVGAMAASSLAFGMAVLQFPDWTHLALVAALFICLELVTNNVVEPLTYGKSAGVSTVALLVAATFWTWLWGPMGLVLSVPLTVILAVLGNNIPQFEPLGVLLGDGPALDPYAVFYQRLLAGDVEEAGDLFEEQLASQGRLHVYDRLLIPALSLAERDRQLGALNAEDQAFVWQTAEDLVTTNSPVPTQQEPVSARLRLIGCPAHDLADEQSLVMLLHVLPAECEMQIMPWKLMASEKAAELEDSSVDAVIIASLGPGGVSHVRYLCKRIRQDYPHMRIIVGRWGHRGDQQRLADGLKARGANDVVSSFAEALELLPRVQPAVVHAQ